MAIKQVIYAEEARAKLKRGVDIVADAVKTTLGPRGRNAIIDKEDTTPIITNDGVTIAKSISVEDVIENIGAQVIKEVASRANDVGGDGTTTATLLAQKLISEGMKNVTAGTNPMALRKGLEKGWKEADNILSSMSNSISKKKELIQVATVSCEDEHIGKIIAEVIYEVGQDGTIAVEESAGFEVESNIQKGFQMQDGYVSPHFINNLEKQEVILEDAMILISGEDIITQQDILPAINLAIKEGKRTIAVFATDIKGEALTTLVLNRLKGIINVLAVKMSQGDKIRVMLLEDIAMATGGQVISQETGTSLAELTAEQMGFARKIIASKDQTIILEGGGGEKTIEDKVRALRIAKDNVETDYDKENIQERIARLSGGIGVISVGAMTDVQRKAIQDKVEDAVNATKIAVAEGIVAGGGVALLRVSQHLSSLELEDREEQIAIDILREALKAPLWQIAENAGQKGDVVVEKVLQAENGVGYNARTDVYEDMIKGGIIDPTRVVRAALESAVSATSILLTTEVVVANKERVEDMTHKTAV